MLLTPLASENYTKAVTAMKQIKGLFLGAVDTDFSDITIIINNYEGNLDDDVITD